MKTLTAPTLPPNVAAADDGTTDGGKKKAAMEGQDYCAMP